MGGRWSARGEIERGRGKGRNRERKRGARGERSGWVREGRASDQIWKRPLLSLTATGCFLPPQAARLDARDGTEVHPARDRGQRGGSEA